MLHRTLWICEVVEGAPQPDMEKVGNAFKLIYQNSKYIQNCHSVTFKVIQISILDDS